MPVADSFSSLLQLLDMGSGLHSGDWGDQTTTNLQKLETAIAAQLATTTTGGTLTLTDDQARNGILAFNGILASNLIIVVPARTKGWTILNQTTQGSNTVSLKSAAGGTNTITIPANSSATYYCDGTLVYSVAPPVNSESGVMKMFGGVEANIPVNHLLCYGQAVSRTTYAALFTAIGTVHGAGDGSTTFNLPDMRGRVPCGPDAMGGVAAGIITATSTLGSAFGEQNHTLTTAEIPAHAHGVTDSGHVHAITDPGHTHTFQESPFAQGPTAIENIPFTGGATTITTSSSMTGISINSAGTGISIQNAGGGTGHNNLQPTRCLNFIIRI